MEMHLRYGMNSRSGWCSSAADAPDWFRTHCKKKILEHFLREIYERETSDSLLVVCRASNAMVTVDYLRKTVANAEYQLLSDEAVESIGKENYVRMVACLGQRITDQYFEKRSGLR